MHPGRCSTAFVLAVSVIVSAGCQTMTPTATKQRAHDRWDRVRAEFKLQRGTQDYDARRFEDAERTAVEAISLDPTMVESYVLLARADLELNKPTSAARAIETARETGLDAPELTYMYGVVLEQRGQLQEAADAYRSAAEADRTKVDYVIAHAESLVALGRARDAQTLLEASVGRFDDDGSIVLLSAHVAALLGDEEGAIRRYRAALELLGNSPTAARELGLLLAHNGRYEEAITRLEPLVDAAVDQPADGAVRLALAEAYVEAGQPLQAKQLLQREIAGSSDSAAAYVIFTKAALATGDELEAKHASATGLRIAPQNDELYLLHAMALWRLGEYAPAEQHLRAYVKRRPEDPTGICLLGEVVRSQGRSDQAADLFRRALDIDPDNVWAKRGLKVIEQVSYAKPGGDLR